MAFGAKKKTGLILTLGLFLILGTSPVGAAEETSGEFLERCLGKVEEIKGSDTEAGIEANVLIFATALLAPELFAICRYEYDVWLFLAAGGGFLAREFAYMKDFKLRSEELCHELAEFKEDKRDKQIKALEKAADNYANAAKAVQARSDNYDHTAIAYAGASALGLFLTVASTPGTGDKGLPPPGCFLPDGGNNECDEGKCGKSDKQESGATPKSSETSASPASPQKPSSTGGDKGNFQERKHTINYKPAPQEGGAQRRRTVPQSLRGVLQGLPGLFLAPAEAKSLKKRKLLKDKFFGGAALCLCPWF